MLEVVAVLVKDVVVKLLVLEVEVDELVPVALVLELVVLELVVLELVVLELVVVLEDVLQKAGRVWEIDRQITKTVHDWKQFTTLVAKVKTKLQQNRIPSLMKKKSDRLKIIFLRILERL